MSIEEFRKIKEELKKLFDEADSYGSTITKEQEINFVNRYINVVNNLLNSDLSNIPFEEWKEVRLFTIDDYLESLDFSKTRANLDFKIFDSSNIEGANFSGCNNRHLEYIESYNLNDYIFDEKTIIENPLVFKEPDLPEEEKNRLKGNLTFEYLFEHPEVRPYVTPLSFRYGISKTFIQKFGFDHAMRFYDEEPKFLSIFVCSEEYYQFLKFFTNLPDMGSINYDEALDILYENIHTWLTTGSPLFGINSEDAPLKLRESYPDLFWNLEENALLGSKYEEGSITLSDLRYNLHLLKNKNLFRGTNVLTFSAVRAIPNLEEYFDNFPPFIDELLDHGRYVFDNNVTFNSNEEIKNAAIAILNKQIEENSRSYFPKRVNEAIAIYDFLGVKVPIHSNNYFSSDDFTITSLNINYDVLKEFHNKYKNLLDYSCNYFGDFVHNLFANYLKNKENYDLSTLESFENEFKGFLSYLKVNNYSTYENLVNDLSPVLHILLPDEFLSETDFNNIYNLINTLVPENSRSLVFTRVTKSLNGDFDSYFSLKSKYSDIAKLIEPKIKKFNFTNYPYFSYICDKLGLNLFLEVINLYGIDNLKDSFIITPNFYDFFQDIDENNYINLINTSIFNTIVANREVDIRTLPDVFTQEYNYLFLPEDAPEDLKKLYYKTTSDSFTREVFNFSLFHDHPDWIPYMKEVRFIYGGNSEEREFFKRLQLTMSDDDIYDLLVTYGHIIYKNISSYTIYDKCNNKEETMNCIIKKIKKFVLHEKVDFLNYPDDFKNRVPEYYLDDNAPEELKSKFYSKTLTTFDFINNPEYINYFEGKSLVMGFPLRYSWVADHYTSFKDQFKIFTMLDKCNNDSYRMFIKSYITNNRFVAKLDSLYSTLLLPDEAPEELKNKFYSQSLSTYDFVENPDYINYLNVNNLYIGFPQKYKWVNDLYPSDIHKQLKIYSSIEKIFDDSLIVILKNYLLEHKDSFDVNKFDIFVQLLSRLSFSNSSEMFNFRVTLADQLLATADPLESLKKIEKIFIENNLPIIGKVYNSFKILYPNLEGFNFDKKTSKYSPQLLNRSTRGKEIMIFSDLVKCAAGSNNRSLKEYLKVLKTGNLIYEKVCTGLVSFDTLSDEEIENLNNFYTHLILLYNNTINGKDNPLEFGNDIIQNISKLKMLLSPDKCMNYNLADRCVEMFCYFAGFRSVMDLETAMSKSLHAADFRHRTDAILHEPIKLHKGDFVKGIGKIDYLGRILQNGSVSKEFLGPSAGSDCTPLDTDLSFVPSDTTIGHGIGTAIAKDFGPIYFVLRNDDRFIDSRPQGKDIDTIYDPSKYECFSTLSEYHYGIRTGFASSEIDYIAFDGPLDDRIALEIVMNGFYIPVINFEGKVLFTPQMYDELKEKMQGLSYYDSNTYKFSDSLVSSEVLEIANQVKDNNKSTRYKRIKIEKAIGEVLANFGIKLKTKLDGDLTEGSAELIDTGSTARGTNKIGEGDFDFMFRFDRSLFFEHKKLEELKTALKAKFESYGPIDNPEMTSNGDFRFKGVTIEDVKVDIDLSFDVKNDKITYSTDRCLQDRLETIEKIDPEKYNLVCANIILAKKVLKEAEVYKSSHSKPAQGGLGGVGVENWILQNGGSFEEAAKSFLEAAKDTSFDDFVKKYQVFDFGENHFSAKNGYYPHDNFVRNNMDASGYEKMKETLQNYLNRNKVEVETIEQSEENIEDFNFENHTGGRS